MKFEGRPHSGRDDAKNIARITLKMMRDGIIFKDNSHSRKE